MLLQGVVGGGESHGVHSDTPCCLLFYCAVLTALQERLRLPSLLSKCLNKTTKRCPAQGALVGSGPFPTAAGDLRMVGY